MGCGCKKTKPKPVTKPQTNVATSVEASKPVIKVD